MGKTPVARKPTHSSKPKGRTQAAKAHTSKAKARRQVHKHQSRKRARQNGSWAGGLAELTALWSRVLKQVKPLLNKPVRVPGMDHDVAFSHVLAFVAVLGLAIGAGYGGAQALFGGEAATHQAATSVIRQGAGAHNVILPDPINGGHAPGALAYEEKVAEEIYVTPPAESRPDVGGTELASLPPAAAPAAPQALWDKNALDFTVTGGAPMIAIVIDDMGVDRKRSRHMWRDVPGPLTLSFMTYADDLGEQTAQARAAGHELMLHMPLEPSNAAVDPGPNALMTAMADADLKRLAEWGIARFDGFVGVNNHMGSRFTEDPRAMRVVLKAVRDKGLLFLDSRTTPKSVVRRVARELGLPVLERNVFLDNDNDVDKVLHQLEQVERLARSHGQAIAIGHPRDATIEVLKTWIPEARARGLNIVPVSVLYRQLLAASG